MRWIDVMQKQVEDARRELEDAERNLAAAGISRGSEASRARYDLALQQLDRAQRAYQRAVRDEARHTVGGAHAGS